MRDIMVEKVVLNVGCGKNVKVEHAKQILEAVSGKKAVITRSKKKSTFGFPKGKEIGCKVTVRKDADAFLARLLKSIEYLNANSFDATGNFSFGIKEYIDVPDMEYNPSIGIIGFDVCISLERKGYRIKRKLVRSKVGKKHLIRPEEAAEFVRNRFGVEIK